MSNLNKIVYRQIEGIQTGAFKGEIEKLISLYYKNPEEIFGMLERDRIFFTAWKGNKMIGFFCCKHKQGPENTILAYLGLLISHPQHARITGQLVFRQLEYLNSFKDKKIYCYILTTNPVIHKIANRFYQNVYPERFNTTETKIPEFYNSVVQFSNYLFDEENLYKVINNPSVARYREEYRTKL